MTNKPMINTLLLAVVAVAAASLFGSADALAQLQGNLGGGIDENEFFQKSADLLDATLGNTQTITYGIAGLGAIGLGLMAFFGKFQWTWFFGLVGGLIIIAGVALGIDYVTGVDIQEGVSGALPGGGGT